MSFFMKAVLDVDVQQYEDALYRGVELQAEFLARAERMKDREAEFLLRVNEARGEDGKLLFTNPEVRAAGLRQYLLGDNGKEAYPVLSSNQMGTEIAILQNKAKLAAVEMRLKVNRDWLNYLAARGAE